MNMPAIALHAQPSGFPVAGNRLVVGGIPLDRLALRVGKTPFYAYDRGLISARVQSLRACLPAGMRLHYSLKANPMPALVQHMAALVDGFDVSSAGELKAALDTTARTEAISFSGPGKTDAELAQAIAAGVLLNLESEGELTRVTHVAEQLGISPRLAVRVNPDFELKSSGMKMGGGPKQFGIDAEDVPQVLRRIHALGLAVEGFHIYGGSQNLRAEAIVEAQARTFELGLRLAQDAHNPIRHLNIGGGFGIPYFPGDRPLDLHPVTDRLEWWMARVRRALPATRVVLELGRYLVGEAGVYVARIIDRKVSRGQTYLITDGGMHHHLAASGNLGQVIRRNYPLAIGNRMGVTEREPVTVTGPLCTPLDTLAERIMLPHAEVGDLVVVFQSGAYGLTASPTAFLGHEPPGEVLV
ncbi:pyridoxal-dependent decarboxylase, exosortase A system-associated [Noviherbaspirillum massiliense]|uniref:pyridoxal-dependent decarboxylase, exosortase A system-associated n=1 Tax=Noviherbaspirillum massiliense TaxID=1465823 RepID=UPI000380C639|nr:pyridoxal-dependent decarboxylase, exosortase A system-associated [Noviherbaspirillum massiliense]